MNSTANAIKLYEVSLELMNAELIRMANSELWTMGSTIEFIAGMGTWFFSDEDTHEQYEPSDEFSKFIDTYVEMFGPTYGPVRFFYDEKVITDW
jgi:hypothetical protein